MTSSWVLLWAFVLLGVLPPPSEGLLCPTGVKYWDEKRAKCRPCTVCSDFALYPCEVYRDTICGSLSSVIELLVEREENGVREGSSNLDWSAEVVIGQDELRNNNSSVVPLTSARPARDGHVLVLASAMAVMLVCLIIMIAIGVHLKRRKRIVTLIENEEILDRLSLHGGRFSMSGRFHPTDQMKYLVDLDHTLAMDRILEQRQQATQVVATPNSIPNSTHNVYVDHLILVNTPQRDVT